MKTKYTVDYFLNKFERIVEELWAERTQGEIESEGNLPHCAMGWCRNSRGKYGNSSPYNNPEDREGLALIQLFLSIGIRSTTTSGFPDITGWNVADVNNGNHPHYQQSTPKQRILAALRDVKAQQEKAQQSEVKERIVYVTVDEPVRELQKKEQVLN